MQTKATPATKAPLKVVQRRPTHSLNDAAVRLRPGAIAQPYYRNGASLSGGYGHVGYVWAVVDGKAVVDFGMTESGTAIRVISNPEDLETVTTGGKRRSTPFARLSRNLAARGAADPKALAASIGRKQVGQAEMTRRAVKAKTKKRRGGKKRHAPSFAVLVRRARTRIRARKRR